MMLYYPDSKRLFKSIQKSKVVIAHVISTGLSDNMVLLPADATPKNHALGPNDDLSQRIALQFEGSPSCLLVTKIRAAVGREIEKRKLGLQVPVSRRSLGIRDAGLNW